MEGDFCLDCKRETQMIVDYASGDTICTDCGLVSQAHVVDERPEWRVFEGDDTEKIRVGASGDPLLGGNDLQTSIDKAPTSMMRTEAYVTGSNATKRLSTAFKEIRRLADRIPLTPSVQDRACELYKDAEKVMKGRNREAVYAACLDLASQHEGDVSWSIKGLSMFCGASISDIHKAKSRLLRHFNGTTNSSDKVSKDDAGTSNENTRSISAPLQIDRHLRRFCSSLNMNVKALRAATEITKAAQEILDIRRSPISIAAACMHIAAVLCDPRVTLSDIARAANISEETIRKTYKDLQPHLGKIVPQWVMVQQ